MRLYVAILAALGLSASACGKKEAPKQEPATQEVKKEEPKKEEPKKEEPKTAETPKEEPKKEEPKTAETPKEEPKKEEPVAAVDRIAGLQQAYADFVAGKFEETFKSFADDATWTDVGSMGEPAKGRQAIIDFHKKQGAGFSEMQMKIGRIIDAGEYVVAEHVWTAKNTGALTPEHKPTGAQVTVPGAILFHYNDKGQVDNAWAFTDQANIMQQAGAMPGLPEGFKAVAMPETTEVVKGAFNPALKDAYMAFGAKMKPDTIDAAIDEMWADDYTMVDFMSGATITGKAAGKEYMKKWMSMMQMESMNPETVTGAGDFLVVVGKSTMIYKGGIPGVEAKDQKITMTGLDISRFENGKFKSYTGYGNGMEVAMGLGMMGGAAEKPAEGDKPADAAAASFGVASCDAYIKGIQACLANVPEAARATVQDSINKTIDAWKQVAAGGDAAKAALEQGCKSALDAAKQSMTAMCPDVKWE